MMGDEVLVYYLFILWAEWVKSIFPKKGKSERERKEGRRKKEIFLIQHKKRKNNIHRPTMYVQYLACSL
jgi:hypothetical protein